MTGQHRWTLGLVSMMVGLLLIVFALQIGGHGWLSGANEGIVRTAAAALGGALVFVVSRRLLSSSHDERTDEGARQLPGGADASEQ